MEEISTRNWLPVTQSLLEILSRHGFQPVCVFDGGEYIFIDDVGDAIAQATLAASDVDEATITLDWEDDGASSRTTLSLVYGNDPDELVADYTVANPNAAAELEQALLDFEDQWAFKPCPTKTAYA